MVGDGANTMSEINVPSMMDFRDAVERIVDHRNQVLIKFLYLSAARVSEVVTRVGKYDRDHLQSWNYGSYMGWSLPEFHVTKTKIEKVLLMKMAVAKRKVKQRKGEDDPEGTRRVVYKMIALPTTPKYEPWTGSLLKHIEHHGNLNFDLSRQMVWAIVTRELHQLDPHIHTHSLRHYRISHLVENYNLDPFDLTAIAGWTFKTTLSAMGQGGASGQLDTYLHLAWRRYFAKLLVPLPED
jgi:integrase